MSNVGSDELDESSDYLFEVYYCSISVNLNRLFWLSVFEFILNWL